MATSMKLLLLIIVAALLAGGILWYTQAHAAPATSFRTAPVARGDLVATISATGTVEPEEVVDVGAQVAGQILTFGQDKSGKSIDYGSAIEAGTVLARIDESLYASDVASSTAQYEQARAGVQRAEADLGQLNSKLFQAQRDWERAQTLKDQPEALAQTQIDAYRAGFEQAKANVAVGEAAIAQAKGTLSQADASLGRAKRNLGYCTITSPVKGVIIDRRVNIGQTVVSSLNAPSLFLIAKDLRRMQVWVSVNEADIGNIHPGQPVSFGVDAYPGQSFHGTVNKIRLNASMTQNVVTYTVEVTTDNPDGKLLPYLTANVQFQVASRQGVLKVPNAALRWIPQTEQIEPSVRASASQDQSGSSGRRGGGPGTSPSGRSTTKRTRAASGPAMNNEPKFGTVWVPEGQYVKPIKVKVGISDGTDTEVAGGDLAENTEVVVAEQRSDSAAAQNRNPFAPNFGGRGPRGTR
jgi:HlyD family secretion protein